MLMLEFKEITPEQDDWLKQEVLYGFYGSIRLGSLFIDSDFDYHYEINGQIELLEDLGVCKTWEDARLVFLDAMFDYFSGEESYYNTLKHMCDELIKEHTKTRSK